MKKLIFLLLFLTPNFSYAEQIIQCGGGYTDKFGISWSPTGVYVEPSGLTQKQAMDMMNKYCPEKPSITPENCSCALNQEPPEGTTKQEISYWLYIRNKDYPTYTGKCSKEQCKEMSK